MTSGAILLDSAVWRKYTSASVHERFPYDYAQKLDQAPRNLRWALYSSATCGDHSSHIQTNSAGDDVSVIDPATNKVVGVIHGIEVNHGAAAAPDGSRYYISNEGERTLDVVDQKTLKVTRSIPLSGHPNNIAISKDGRRVYVSIAVAPGAVDVVDTTSLEKVRTIPVKGAVHNTYVTPDGNYVVSGSIASKTITVIDQKTEEPVWWLVMDQGIRPMAFAANPDGSTKWIFVQLSGFNGFAVVDFATRKEINRIKNPDLPAGKAPYLVGGSESHGMAGPMAKPSLSTAG